MHAAMAAAFCDEAATRSKRLPDAGDDVVRSLHPMERRIREHGVELGAVEPDEEAVTSARSIRMTSICS